MSDLYGFYALTRREVARFVKVLNQTIIAPLISSMLYILIFGLFIGQQVKDINGFSYIEFIIPGVIMMSVIMNSYVNSSSSIFIAKWQNNIQEILVSPLSYLEMVLALTLGGVLRGVAVGLIIMLVSLFFAKVLVVNILAFLFFLFFTALIFSSLGVMSGLWAEKFDHLAILTSFMLTPLIYLGGVFYSIDLLPGILRNISLFNPMLYMINGLRYGMIGLTDVSILFSTLLVLSFSIIIISVNVYLFKIGYKLRT